MALVDTRDYSLTVARTLLIVMVATLYGAVLSPSVARADSAGGDAVKGRAIAEKHCSRCHVVGDFNKFGGIGSTPSLQGIKYLADWRDRFQTFYLRRPHPAFVRVRGIAPPTKQAPYTTPVEILPENVADILAFAETLPTPK